MRRKVAAFLVLVITAIPAAGQDPQTLEEVRDGFNELLRKLTGSAVDGYLEALDDLEQASRESSSVHAMLVSPYPAGWGMSPDHPHAVWVDSATLSDAKRNDFRKQKKRIADLDPDHPNNKAGLASVVAPSKPQAAIGMPRISRAAAYSAAATSDRPDPDDFFGDRTEELLRIADDMGRDQIASLTSVNDISEEARSWMDAIKANGGSTNTRQYVAFAMIDVGAEQVNKNNQVIKRIEENSLLPDPEPTPAIAP